MIDDDDFSFSIEEPSSPLADQSPSLLPPTHVDVQTLEENDRAQRPSTTSSTSSFAHAQPEQIDHVQQEKNISPSTQEQSASKSKPYNHDVLVIETQPPKVGKKMPIDHFDSRVFMSIIFLSSSNH